MSATTGLEELGVSRLGEVGEAEFTGLAERHRRELHVHSYRMLGSFEDAGVVRGCRGRGTGDVPAGVAGAGELRGAGHVPSLAVSDRHQRLPRPAGHAAAGACRRGEVLWLQPYPDALLDELPAVEADEPEAVAVARETIELAYLVAVQHLALDRGPC